MKCSNLVTIQKPITFVWFWNGPVLGWPVPDKLDYLGIGQVQFSDGYYIILDSNFV
jgi:hypothetical protein